MIKYSNKIRLYCQKNKTCMLVCLIFTYLFGFIAHAYGLLNNIFSHDALNAIYAGNIENNAKISVGRFVVPVIRYIFRGQLAIPWLIGFVAFFYLAITVYIIVKMFNIHSKLSIVLISAIMVTNNTITGCIATYVHEFDINMLALTLAVFCVYIWKKSSKCTYSVFSVLLLIVSLGIYQSNVTIVATLMICCIITDLIENFEFKKELLKGLQGLGIIAVGTIAYYVLSNILIKVTDVAVQNRADMLNVSDSLTADISYINGFNSMIFYEIQKIINPVSILPKTIIASANILVLAFGVITALILIHKISKNHIKEKLLSVLLLLLIPIAAGCICIITKGELHDIMTFAFWLIPAFIVVLINKLNNLTTRNRFYNITTVISVICIAIITLNSILVANNAYLKKDLEHDATLSAMTQMSYDLNRRDDYVPGETKIYFIGADFLKVNSDKFNEVEKIVGLNYNTSIGVPGKEWYYCSYEKYFVNYLGQPLNHVDNSFITTEIHDAIIQMPSFPKNGYMQKFGDVLVIKMS